MNMLFSSSWTRAGDDFESGGGAGLDQFFEDVESIKGELRDLEHIQCSLQDDNERGKALRSASAVRALRSRMEADVAAAINKAKVVKLRLESLDRANAANRSVSGCGPGSSTDRMRTSVVAGLREKHRDSMESFSSLRSRIGSEYRDTVARRYFTVTGSRPDEATLDNLAETGEGERLLQQGRGELLGVVAEIQERHGAVAQLERSLLELQQVFMDMAVLVDAQSEWLDDIQREVEQATSAMRQLAARKHQMSSRKWMCLCIGRYFPCIVSKVQNSV